jgi:UDPglucose 6-dehydrogenase
MISNSYLTSEFAVRDQKTSSESRSKLASREKSTKITIVGSGIVGTATALSLAKNTCNSLEMYDVSRAQEVRAEQVLVASPWNVNSIEFHPKLEAAVEGAAAVIVAVPTPISTDDKPYDYSIINEVVRKITEATSAPLIIRSTVDPLWLRKTASRIKNDLIFMPEFLREASYLEDAVAPNMIVVGANRDVRVYMDKLLRGYQCPKCYVSLETASMLKLALNSFLATKISYFNEIKRICDGLPNANANVIFEICSKSRHLTDGAWGVYGGKPYGGKCLPKDIRALISISNSGLLKSVKGVNDRMGADN